MFAKTIGKAVGEVTEKASVDVERHVENIRGDIQGGALLIAGALFAGLLVVALVLADNGKG